MRIPKRVLLRIVFSVPLFILLLAWATFGAPSSAQSEPVPTSSASPAAKPDVQVAGTPIRVSTDLILVPVSVTDSEQRPVSDLSENDFRILEEGKVQTIANLHKPGQSPVELALMVDISGSVSPRFRFEQEAGARFLKEMVGPNRPVTVFTMGTDTQLMVPRTFDPKVAVDGLLSMTATRQATAFFEGVARLATYLDQIAPPFSRRVQIVISDGEDNYSIRRNLEGTLRELQRADCLFYAINPATHSLALNSASREGNSNLQTLARQTGGASYVPATSDEFAGIYKQIAADLQAQYLLGYYSSERQADGKYRKISVTVPERPNLRVRARQGYFSPGIAEKQGQQAGGG